MSGGQAAHLITLVMSAAALSVAGLSTGCAPRYGEWFEPNWDRVLDRERALSTTPEAPRPQPIVPVELPVVSDDGVIELSVEEAVLLALRHNRDLSVQQFTPAIVGAFEEVERGVFDPEVFGELSFSREELIETARATGEQFSARGEGISGTIGLRQNLPTGTTVDLDVNQNRNTSNRAPEQQEARFGLTVTQALLRGFGAPVNLANVRQAELDTLASRYELRGFTESLMADAEIAYWQYILAQEQIAIFEESLAIARQQRDQVDERIDVGVLAQTEAAAARSEVALREQALIDAQSALTARRLELLRIINCGPTASLDREICATTEPQLDPLQIDDLISRIEVAQLFRADLNEARLRLDQNRLETIITRNGLLPRLDLFMALGKTGFSDTFPRSFREVGGATYDFNAGVSFSHFLGNRTAEGLHQAALASRAQAAAAVHNLQQLVELDVRLAVNEAERARRQIAATTITRELQQQTVAAEQERFDVGSSTTLLVAQAQRDLLEAQIAEVEAVISYRIALVQLYRVEGSLLERRGIRIEMSNARAGAP